MPVDILKVEVYDDINGTSANYLRGGIGSLYHVKVYAYFHDEVLQEQFQFIATGSRIYWSLGGFLNKSFRPGGKITVAGSLLNNGTYDIVGVSNKYIDVSQALTNETKVCDIHDVTPVKKIDYYGAAIKNSEGTNYLSKLDGITAQRWLGTNITNTPTVFTAFVPYASQKHWLSASAAQQALIGVTWGTTGSTNVSTGFEQVFTIDDYFNLPPYLEKDFNGDELDFSLTDYFADECLRWVGRIDVGNAGNQIFASSDTGNIQQFLSKGNTGWYDETLNGQAQQFTLDSILFTDPTSGGQMDSLSPDQITHVSIAIDATGGTIAAGTNKGRIGFCKVIPKGTAAGPGYIQSNQTMRQNMKYDAELINGSSGPDGTYIKDTVFTVSGGQFLLEFDFDPGTDFVEGDSFLLFMDVQDTGTTNLSTSNKTTLKLAEKQFKSYLNIEDLGESRTVVVEPPLVTQPNGFTEYKGWIHDPVLIYHEADIADENPAGQAQTLNSIQLRIEVWNTNGDNFELYAGQEIEPGQSGTLGYNMEPGDLKNEYSLDTGTPGTGLTTYLLMHGLKLRFEDWLAQFNAPSNFNQTKNWSNYFELISTGWQPYFVIYENREINGTVVTKKHRTKLSPLNFKEFDDCEVQLTIDTFGVTTGTNYGGKLIETEDIKVVATFTGPGLDCYDFDTTDFWGFLEYYRFGIDNVFKAEPIFSGYITPVNNGWQGTPFALLMKGTNEVTIECILNTSNASLFNVAQCYTIMARLGKFTSPVDPPCVLPDIEYETICEPYPTIGFCDTPNLKVSLWANEGIT